MFKRLLIILLLLIAAAVGGLYAVGKGWLGQHEGPGEVTQQAIPDAVVASRTQTRQQAAQRVGQATDKQILFGDLHVHTTVSTDAFMLSLPMLAGEGAHPQADACDFARYCSALDFWSINDHAEALTPTRWRDTVESIRQCNAVAGDPDNPDTVAFLGWEWTQVGTTPLNHYGHKNVILRHLDDENIPARPIAAGGQTIQALGGTPLINRVALFLAQPNARSLDFATYNEELQSATFCPPGIALDDTAADCVQSAATPKELFAKLNEWGGESLVIPHGTTWGFYTPAGSAWDKQLKADMHDPNRQKLVEVFSGHGNSEEYRDFRAVTLENDSPSCPAPSENYLPSCWRAGELIRKRCLAENETEAECERRAVNARQNYVNAGVSGFHAVPQATNGDWLDSGQCRDCFLPSFNYRPASAVQYMMALTNFDDPANPKRFRFGFMASSDNHKARPGTGFKEFGRRPMTEATGPASETAPSFLTGASPPDGHPASVSRRIEFSNRATAGMNLPKTDSPTKHIDFNGPQAFQLLEAERQASFFLTGGLIAAHSTGRNRDAIWTAMNNREVYGTSGDRILLWFDLLNGPAGSALPMGSETRLTEAPIFQVRAVGALEQLPGCPAYSTNALSPERLAHVCKNECYHPSDTRKLITRIEVVRIRPQIQPDEPIGPLIEDPWRVFHCEPDEAGCEVKFSDPDYAATGRDTLYYVRAIEAPSLAVNADNLRCEYDENGQCIKVNPCFGDYRTAYEDDCLAENEERAWSSPIFVDYL